MVGEVILDLQRQIPGMPEIGGERGDVTNPDGRVVAVVDDDAAVCESTRSLLEAFGFEVSTYSSGADFIREDPEVACLIVDHWMPGLNGLEFVSELKARGRQVPTIMITATNRSRGGAASSRARHQACLAQASVGWSAASRYTRRAI